VTCFKAKLKSKSYETSRPRPFWIANVSVHMFTYSHSTIAFT
jgi:hypothetical protein